MIFFRGGKSLSNAGGASGGSVWIQVSDDISIRGM